MPPPLPQLILQGVESPFPAYSADISNPALICPRRQPRNLGLKAPPLSAPSPGLRPYGVPIPGPRSLPFPQTAHRWTPQANSILQTLKPPKFTSLHTGPIEEQQRVCIGGGGGVGVRSWGSTCLWISGYSGSAVQRPGLGSPLSSDLAWPEGHCPSFAL